jgi:hypothetical protein
VQAVDNIKIKPGEIVNLTRLGNRHAEVVYMEKEPRPGIIKINKEQYVVIQTGEVKNFKVNEGKQVEYLRKVFRKLEHLIKTNFDTEENEHNALFVTLTYKENMQDAERLLKDFEKYYKRLQYEYSSHKLEYIAVAEPQGRGAWHMHVLIKSDKPIFYIDNKIMAKIWGHGFTETERIKGRDPGKYFAAYFTSLEAEKEDDPNARYVKDKNGKKYKKGARLHFYPKGMKFYRCSRGISRPSAELAVYDNVTHEYGKPVNTTTLEVTSTKHEGEELLSEGSINTIQREEFRKSRVTKRGLHNGKK